MIEKYYNGVIEQVAGGIGNVEHNSILVRYSNDFSIWDLESVNHYKDQTDIFFTCHEFSYNKIAEAYEPYLGLIRQMFHKYCSGTLEEFMEECDVYKLQRPVFESYFEKGFCERTEQILIDEVEYDRDDASEIIRDPSGRHCVEPFPACFEKHHAAFQQPASGEE